MLKRSTRLVSPGKKSNMKANKSPIKRNNDLAAVRSNYASNNKASFDNDGDDDDSFMTDMSYFAQGLPLHEKM